MNCTEQQIALLNNEAVSLLASGATARAFKTFKNALALLNNPTRSTKSYILHKRNESTRKKDQNFGGVDTPIATSFVHEGGYYVYTRPYLFNSEETTSSDVHVYSAAIMFNMALTLHIQNQSTHDKATKRSALRLYDATLSILEETSSEIPECMKIRIATLNNQAHMYYELYQFDKARQVLAMLLEAISSREDRSTFHQKDIEEFLQNDILLGTSAAAPAA